MNNEIELLYDRAVKHIAKINNTTNWNWDCDKSNDYFAIYNDACTVSFSYKELLDGVVLTATIMNHEEDELFDAVKSFKESLQQVKLHREGKIKLETWSEFSTRIKRNILLEIARENTKRNELGQTTISEDDYTFTDDVWDRIFEKEEKEHTEVNKRDLKDAIKKGNEKYKNTLERLS